MIEKSADIKIRELLEEHFQKRFPDNMLARPPALFDTSRPNIHDSKSEFLREQNTVKQVIEHLSGLIALLAVSADSTAHEEAQMTDRLREAIDANVTQVSFEKFNKSASGLAIKNVIDTGFYFNSLVTIFHMRDAYRQRLVDLKEQKKEFWSVSNRPPNYYARAIALRFAKFYVWVTGRKPTFGTSRDGPHPSTDYGRLLEKIFKILKIDGDYKRAGRWATSQITDDEVNPPTLGLLKFKYPPPWEADDPAEALLKALAKSQSEKDL